LSFNIFHILTCYLLFVEQVIVRVFGEGGAATDVPVTPETTCRDLVECTRDPGDEQCSLVELWRDCGKKNFFLSNRLPTLTVLYIQNNEKG